MRGTDHRRVRLAWLFALTLPAAFVAWVGCGGDDKSGSSHLLEVDPGGTYGAEVVVNVKGRGRVTASMPGLECPSDCFARFVFADKTKAGNAAGVVLKAEATPGSRFVGFTFDTVNLGTRGDGPDTCNPLTRATSQPPAPPNGDEVVLPFGETQGTPPAGASCGGANNVPLAYVVTATFETPEIPEAGPPDAGFDAGPPPGDPVFDPPAFGAVGKEIGYAGGYLYWRYDVSGQSGIAYGSPTSFSQTPTSIVSPSNQVTKFDVSPYAVVYQRSNGSLNVISAGSTFSTTLSGAPTCENVGSDSSYAYCLKSDGYLYAWTLGGSGPTTLGSGLPTGNDRFGVNSSYLYFVDDPSGATGAATIKRASKAQAPDAGVPAFTTITTSQTNPIQLAATSSYVGWINYDTLNDVGTLQRDYYYTGGSLSTLIPATNGLRLLSSDPSSSSYFYGGVVPTGQILKATGGTPTTLTTGIQGLGGITADGSYVYWTAGDGRVYRHSKF